MRTSNHLDFAHKFGKRLRILRQLKGMTQEELAAGIGLSKRQLIRIELGESSPTFPKLEKICQALETSLLELLLFSDGQGHDPKAGSPGPESKSMEIARFPQPVLAGLWWIDRLSNSMSWTPSLFAFLGYSIFSVQSSLKRFLSRVHPRNKEQVEQFILGIRNEGSPGRIMIRMADRKSIERTVLLIREQPPANGSGETICLAVLDVTETLQVHNLLSLHTSRIEETLISKNSELARTVENLEREVIQRIIAEDRLRGSKAELSSIIENAPTGMALMQPDGSISRANWALCELLGYSSNDLLAMGYLDAIHPDDQEEVQEHLDGLLAGNDDVMTSEKRFLHRTGHVLWVVVSTLLVRNQEGRPLHFISQVMDTTQRKASERSLEKNRIMMAEAERLAKVGSWEWDPSRNHLSFSEGWLRIHGCDEPPGTVDQVMALAHPDDKQRIELASLNTSRTGAPYDLRHRIIRRDTGEVRHVQAFGVLRPDSPGRPGLIYGACQDVSAEVEAENIIREKQRELEEAARNNLAIMDASPNSMLVLNSAGRVILDNLAAREMLRTLGCDVPESDRCGDYLDCQNRKDHPSGCGYSPFCCHCAINAAVQDVLKGKADHIRGQEREIVLGREGTRSFWVSFNVSPVTLHGELCAILAMEDITRRKLAEERLRLQAALMKLAAESSSAIARAVSPAELDAVINRLLQDLGELFAVDRSYLFLFSPDCYFVSNTHEWCAQGVESQMERNQNISIRSMPYFRQYLGAVLHVPDVEALPPDAAHEKQHLLSQDIRSMLCLPINNRHENLIGFFGFDVLHRRYQWPKEQIMLLGIMADSIGNVITRMRGESAAKSWNVAGKPLNDREHDE